MNSENNTIANPVRPEPINSHDADVEQVTTEIVANEPDHQLTHARIKELIHGRDAGMLARNKVITRRQKVARVFKNIAWLMLLILMAGGTGVGYLVHLELAAAGERVTDTRPCLYVNEAMGVKISGKRDYSYMQRSFFGFEYRDAGAVDRRTELDVNGAEMHVVGFKDSGYWTAYIPMGERGIELLKPADNYVFTTGKHAVVITDEQFCR